MAEVYKARAVEGPRKNQLVALKRLTPRLASDPEAVDLFCGEADVSAMLKHPNIVEVFEAGVVGEVYYLAMEYVDGRDLALILARCRERRIFLPVHFAVHIAKATLDALAYAHAARGPTGLHLNIVHCDVSPSHLFISRPGEARLGDVVLRPLQIDPASRYAGAQQFAEAREPFHDEISGGALGIASVVRGLFRS